MAKFLTLAQMQKEFGITMRSLKELMQREIYEPVKSIADQAKAIAASVRKDADEGRFNGAPGPQGEPGTKGDPGEVTEAELTAKLAGKVDKETGKELSTNDYTDADKAKVDGLPESFVSSVNGKTGSAELTASDVGAASQAELAGKVDKETGKGLSSNDYTDGDKAKVDGLPESFVSSVNGKTGDASLDASDVGAAAQDMISDAWNSTTTYSVGEYCIYENKLWKCLVQNSGQTPEEGTYWTATSVAEEIRIALAMDATFSTVSAYSSRASDISGGFVKVGNIVYVDVSFKIVSGFVANSWNTYLTGFPIKKTTGRTALSAAIEPISGQQISVYNAFINTLGYIGLVSGPRAVQVGDIFYISGTYIAE